MAQAFVVVVDGNGQHFFRRFLADDVVVQMIENFLWRWQIGAFGFRRRCGFFELENMAAGFDAFVADVAVQTFNQLFNLAFGFAAKGAGQFVVITFCGHGDPYSAERLVSTLSIRPYSTAACADK